MLAVELPFWIMTPNCELMIDVCGHRYAVSVVDDYVELLEDVADDSLRSCIYFGPMRVPGNVFAALESRKCAATPRKCKTVVLITTRCNSDALIANSDPERRGRDAEWYFRSLCDAHIEIVNKLVQQYRLATYDLFAYELAPWDVPVWFALHDDQQLFRICLLEYANFDCKPHSIPFEDIDKPDAHGEPFEHVSFASLQDALAERQPSDGEFELLDALNFMIRGGYSDAVRRITTAIEAILESALRRELIKRYPSPEVEQKLLASRSDFPGRLRQYEKLSGRRVADHSRASLDRIRELRHEIVHCGRRLSFSEGPLAERCVDTGRWIYNWIEDDATRRKTRETKNAFRSLGKHFHIIDSSLTADGAVVTVMSWPAAPPHDEIAIAAYFLWERNGRQEGKDVEYWTEAEKNVWMQHWRLHEANGALNADG